MIKNILTATALVAVAAPAFAGGLAPSAPEAVVTAPVEVAAPVVVAAGADWTGFYLGGQVATSIDEDTAEGETYGLFAGYNKDFGSIVAGAELGYADASDLTVAGEAADEIVTAKAKVGYDLGSFLPYATVGAAQLKTAAGDDTGYTYGVGVDYALTNAWTIGAEIAQYEFEEFNGGADVSATTAGLRAAFNF